MDQKMAMMLAIMVCKSICSSLKCPKVRSIRAARTIRMKDTFVPVASGCEKT
eukprot:CAMPEP_0172893084 /NCGR_PEP_ID=MMETSP1075-20121228/147683_1 /TAXON_ID=2916 /ORGANISM="Ceratium fusus, Strain PA161109" /LENGTH=51 /DNA_ID=CAMNT_0013747885 /DNA_START=37 /DNA_END=188 /DNA_ORIENTATION=+